MTFYTKKNKIVLSLVVMGILSVSVHAADWISIAGTEPSFIKKEGEIIENHNNTPYFWGFIQVGYQKNNGDIFIPKAGPKTGLNLTPFSMLTPNLNAQSGFEVNRARLAVRGMVDKENTLNYFFMTEFGEDGITKPAGHASNNYLTDASITYRGIPYFNIRVGQFKYPGSEEGLRAVFASSYRNFSTAGSQLLLERFLPNHAQEIKSNIFQAIPKQSVGAYRDRGIELFHTAKLTDKTTFTWAGMIGSGTGMSSSNASDTPTYYAYLATEYLFGKGKGYYIQSLKGFAWYQNGKRLLNNTNYTRERYGIGLNYFHNGLRVGAEYIKAKGMIYNGAKDVDHDPFGVNWEYQIAADKNNEADGGYINLAYFFVPKKWEAMIRYDYLNRLSNSVTGQRKFKTTTLGISYHFKGPTRIDVNYAFRDADAPNNNKAQKVLENIGNLLSLQATLKF